MSLVIDLSPEVEERIQKESRLLGVEATELVKRMIDSTFPESCQKPGRLSPEEQRVKNQAAIELLRQLREEGDVEEQKDTLRILMEGLNANHSSYRKTFP